MLAMTGGCLIVSSQYDFQCSTELKKIESALLSEFSLVDTKCGCVVSLFFSLSLSKRKLILIL